MPLQPKDTHTANDPLLEESSNNQAKTILAPVDHQRIVEHDTASSDNSDSDDSKPNKPLLDLNNINKMKIKHPSEHCYAIYPAQTSQVSVVACLKAEIYNRVASIMNPVKLCNNACGITILNKICSRVVSITFLARKCSNGFAIAGFN